jgi:hypothetical protein
MTVRQHIKIAEAYRHAADRLRKAADAAHRRAEAEWAAVWAHMHDEGWELGDDTKQDGTRYGMQVTYYGTVNDPLEFNRWAQECADHLIQPKPRQQLINEEVQRRIDAGEPMPPGVTAFPKRRVSRRAV